MAPNSFIYTYTVSASVTYYEAHRPFTLLHTTFVARAMRQPIIIRSLLVATCKNMLDNFGGQHSTVHAKRERERAHQPCNVRAPPHVPRVYKFCACISTTDYRAPYTMHDWRLVPVFHGTETHQSTFHGKKKRAVVFLQRLSLIQNVPSFDCDVTWCNRTHVL